MRPLDIALAVLVAAVWGGNFVSAKFGMSHFPPLFLSALRFAFTAALLLPFVPRPNGTQARRILALASVLGVSHFALMFVALHLGLDIPSCAIVGQLGVPFSCLLGVLLLGDRLGPWRICGMAIAFAGMMIVAGTPNILLHPPAFALGLAGAFCWGLSNIMIKKLNGIGSMPLLAWMALFTVPQLLILSLVFEGNQWELLRTTTLPAVGSVAYTVFGSTLFAYGCWSRLIQKYPLSQIAPYSLLTVPFGILFGQLWFHADLTWQILVGGAITVAGVAIIVVRRPQTAVWAEAT